MYLFQAVHYDEKLPTVSIGKLWADNPFHFTGGPRGFVIMYIGGILWITDKNSWKQVKIQINNFLVRIRGAAKKEGLATKIKELILRLKLKISHK